MKEETSYPLPLPRVELNEERLLVALARYNREKWLIWEIKRKIPIAPSDWDISEPYVEKLTKILKKGTIDPEILPALGIAKRYGVMEKFEGLLEWIRPILTSIPASADDPIIPTEMNLASSVFSSAWDSYNRVLTSAWYYKFDPEYRKSMWDLGKRLEQASKKLHSWGMRRNAKKKKEKKST